MDRTLGCFISQIRDEKMQKNKGANKYSRSGSQTAASRHRGNALHVMLFATAAALTLLVVIGAAGWTYFQLKRNSIVPKQEVHSADITISKLPGLDKNVVNPSQDLAWTKLEDVYKNYKFDLTNEGNLRANNQTYRLYGISMPTRSQVCTYQNGERWACGQRAYIALLNFIGSTTIDCRAKDITRPDILMCRLAGIDISEWMLRNGWAYLAKEVTDKRYVTAASDGISNKLGMYSLLPQ